MDGSAKIEFKKCRRRMRKRQNRCGPMGDAPQNSKQRGGEYADQDSAVDFSRHENESQRESKARCLHLFIGKITEPNKGRGIRYNELRIAEPHESNKHSDACGRGMFKAIRHAIDNLLAHASYGKQQKHYSRKENHRQRCLPGYVHVEADGISEVS